MMPWRTPAVAVAPSSIVRPGTAPGLKEKPKSKTPVSPLTDGAGQQAAARVAGVPLAVHVARVEAVVGREVGRPELEERAARERKGGELLAGREAEHGGDAADIYIRAGFEPLRAARHRCEGRDADALVPVACGHAFRCGGVRHRVVHGRPAK